MAETSEAATRVRMEADPFAAQQRAAPWYQRAQWPASWIAPPASTRRPWVAAFALRFSVDRAIASRLHVSADERYELWLDGSRVGRGPERGDRLNWYYESYAVGLEPGEHVLVARVWALGPGLRPLAQFSVEPGFLLAGEGDLQSRVATGGAPWRVRLLKGYTFTPDALAWGVGAKPTLDAARYAWDHVRGPGDDWEAPRLLAPAENGLQYHGSSVPLHPLRPAPLPAMIDRVAPAGRVRHIDALPAAEADRARVDPSRHLAAELSHWQGMLAARQSVTVPAHTCRRVIVDLEQYVCAYPEMAIRGGRGGEVRLSWAEALYEQPPQDSVARSPKGHRDEIAGKCLVGVSEVFRPDGPRRRFETLWWQAGRYLELRVRIAEAPMTFEGITLHETRYPLELDSRFACDDSRLTAVMPAMVRAMQMCSHETYMDCPYYEQLMYVGDTRLEALTHHVMSLDDALPCKAVAMFDQSRVPGGLTQSRYPCEAMQLIPGFSLWWVCMVHDLALWRGRRELVRRMMPGVRAVLEAFEQRMRNDGLFDPLSGWMFLDWCSAWERGVPPTAADAPTAAYHWQLVYTLRRAAELERWVGRPAHAERCALWACEVSEAIHRAFFDDPRGLYAEDLDHTHFTEHAQCLALLSGGVPSAASRRVRAGLLQDRSLTRTTIYFTHYLFEAYRQLGAMEAMFDRLGEWFELPERGFLTTREKPEPTRSDCHAWGAHPLYHYFATILGIRPGAFGFTEVQVRPQLGPLSRAEGQLVHPAGVIDVSLQRRDDGVTGRIQLPQGVRGTLEVAGRCSALSSGVNGVGADP